MSYVLSPALRAALEARCPREIIPVASLASEVGVGCEAFYLGFDFSHAVYLTIDGRLFWEHDDLDGSPRGRFVEQTGTGGAVALVLAAKQTGLSALLSLIPPPPEGASSCPQCRGTHRAPLFEGFVGEVICVGCAGVGWVLPDEPAAPR